MPRVMIVEDQELILENVAQLLRLSGLDVVEALDGSIAYELLCHFRDDPTQRPKLIISDLMMPIMDGFELLSLVRSDPVYEQVPFVLLTARSDVSDLKKALTLGASEYLIKPFEVEELMAVVTDQLSGTADRGKGNLGGLIAPVSDFELE